MDKAETKKVVAAQLRKAASWNSTARRDIAREDRIDALDAIDMSMRELTQARALITATLPPELRA